MSIVERPICRQCSCSALDTTGGSAREHPRMNGKLHEAACREAPFKFDRPGVRGASMGCRMPGPWSRGASYTARGERFSALCFTLGLSMLHRTVTTTDQAARGEVEKPTLRGLKLSLVRRVLWHALRTLTRPRFYSGLELVVRNN